MKLRTLFVATSFLAIWAVTTQAPAQSQDNSVGSLVTIDVLIAEVSDSRPKGDDVARPVENRQQRTAKDLLELDKQGNLAHATRVHLSTVENQKTSVQLGERVAIPSGRAAIGRGGFGGQPSRGDGPSAGPQFATSYTLENVGTIVAGTARLESPESILVELKIEKSRFVDEPSDNKERNENSLDVPRPRMVTLSSDSTVRLRSGEPTLVKSFGTHESEGDKTQYIVVTAKAEQRPAQETNKAQADTGATVRVFALANAEAQEAVKLLTRVYANNRMRVAADERTNSVILQAEHADVDGVEALLQRLDETPPRKNILRRDPNAEEDKPAK